MRNISFTCPICGNSDNKYIGFDIKNKPYCRLCCRLSGSKASYKVSNNVDYSLHLDYPLSEKQQEIANQMKSHLIEKHNVLVHAVTGAGKTELIYESFKYYLSKNRKVGFATPRKDVVIDLTPRFKDAFPKCNVVSIYGDHSSVFEGDILVLTTHQLYRYNNYFDLIVLDEIDAFPYKGNKQLETIFRKCIKGNYVLLSATPSSSDIKKIKEDDGVVLQLFERYHKHDLPLPTFIKGNYYSCYLKCLKYLRHFIKENKKVFVFTPTIDIGKSLYSFLSLFIKNGDFVSSKEEERSLIIERFKKGYYSYLVTTSILERGVTIENLQVIVFRADNTIYDCASLIQIAGRAGRKIKSPNGQVIFIGEICNDEIKKAITEIKKYNEVKNNGKVL